MPYKIRRKHSFPCDDNYVDGFGNECNSIEAKSFRSREDAEKEKGSLTWHHNGFQSDWEVI